MKKLKFGIIGIGRLGGVHAENLASRIAGTEVVAICDINLQRAQEAAEKLGVEKTYANYNDMFKEVEMDAVVIATPPDVHCECIVAACAAKVHIFCEKPVGVTQQDLAEIKKAQSENGEKIIQIGFMRRFDK